MTLDELTRGNLIEPITFDTYAEAGKFVRDRRCALCLGSLIRDFGPGRTYIVKCIEHGPVHEHNHIHRAEAEKIKDGQLTGSYELRN